MAGSRKIPEKLHDDKLYMAPKHYLDDLTVSPSPQPKHHSPKPTSTASTPVSVPAPEPGNPNVNITIDVSMHDLAGLKKRYTSLNEEKCYLLQKIATLEDGDVAEALNREIARLEYYVGAMKTKVGGLERKAERERIRLEIEGNGFVDGGAGKGGERSGLLGKGEVTTQEDGEHGRTV